MEVLLLELVLLVDEMAVVRLLLLELLLVVNRAECALIWVQTWLVRSSLVRGRVAFLVVLGNLLLDLRDACER